MPRLLSSLLVLLLGAWPARPGGVGRRGRLGGRLPSRLGADEPRDPVDAPDRARARASATHHWPGQLVVSSGARRTVVHGRWRLTLSPAERAQGARADRTLALDPARAESWSTQLEALLTLQVPGARLRVAQADGDGWQLLEVRAPTQPETVVQVDRASLGRLLGAPDDTARLEMRVQC